MTENGPKDAPLTKYFQLHWESIKSSLRDELGLVLGWTGLGLVWDWGLKGCR